MNEVVVTGIGLLSCLGNLKQTWQGLLVGKSGIKLHQLFPEFPILPLGLIYEQTISLDSLTRQVVKDAIADACLEVPLSDCGVVVGSSRGCQAIWEEILSTDKHRWTQMNEDNLSVQNYDWLKTLPNRAAIATAEVIGSSDVVLAPMAACSTGLWAIAQAMDLIETGRCQRVIAGAVEAPISKLTIAGFQSMGALAKTGCYPFDRDREGLVLGEGGAVFVLESAELAKSRGAKIYGQVLGFGLTCDAYHLSAPEMKSKSALLAVKHCLSRSNLKHDEIDFIHAHGTSTQLNDRNEAELIEYLFGDRVLVSSTKGATGHTLGASGAIATAFCLMSLRHQQLPPCVGLKESEFNLNLVEAWHCHISQSTHQFKKIENVLCFSFGFGGQNTVIAFKQGVEETFCL